MGGEVWAEMLDQWMVEEFDAWEKALAHQARVTGASPGVWPHPCAPGGLPVGWHVRYAHGVPGNEVMVVERAGGGWTMVLHWTDAAGDPTSMKWWHTTSTVAGLYQATASRAHRHSGPEQAVRDYLLTMYDLTDPAEEAEVTLVGLGARITVYPKALTEQ
jgi:hypothetical protein